jgi:hypothetical protein
MGKLGVDGDAMPNLGIGVACSNRLTVVLVRRVWV